ncbi:amino acid adenylation domain-containing protein [Puniceicoccaceae bacterium K14]|nr:amino acid adenylation domain-containing protein [Puniceicoccaceae bacterium K14]
MSSLSKRIEGLSPKQKELLQKLAARKKAASGTKVDRIPKHEGEGQLSYQQMGLWTFQIMNPESSAYNDTSLIRISGSLDLAHLKQSIDCVLGRHEILRTRIKVIDGLPVSVVENDAFSVLETLELSSSSYSSRETKMMDQVAQRSRGSFDLAEDLPIRVTLFKLDEGQYGLLIIVHHIANDAWSRGIFIREVIECYQSYSRAETPKLPSLSVQYSDYSAWQRERTNDSLIEKKLEYLNVFGGSQIPTVEVPTDKPRPSIQSFVGNRQLFTIPSSLARSLKNLAKRERTTLFNIALGALNVLLYRYTGQKDLVVGTPVANRSMGQLEPLIGFFMNMVAIPAQMDGRQTFSDFLRNLHRDSFKAISAQDVPFEKVVEKFQTNRDASRSPIFQVLFLLQTVPEPLPSIGDLEFKIQDLHDDTSRFDLSISITDSDDELAGFIEYNQDLYNDATVQRLISNYLVLLESIVERPDSPISELKLLSENEENRLLVEWNDTEEAYPKAKCIHELIEEQSAANSERIAAVFNGENISYGELNRRANRLARLLRDGNGVSRGDIVGLMVDRSFEMLVGMVAILKSGAAYMPIDPKYPEKRIQHMVEDSGCRVLLSRSHIAELTSFTGQRVELDDVESLGAFSSDNLSIEADAKDLAYVIYTSGSTGKPKGVMIENRNVVNFMQGMVEVASLHRERTVVSVTTICFDIFVLESLVPLMLGMTVLVASEEEQLDPLKLNRLIRDGGADIVQATPSLMREIVSSKNAQECLKSIESFLVGGEAFPEDLFELIRNCSSGDIINVYGPTETTVWSTASTLNDGVIDIGRPIANTRVYILDECDAVVPIGAVGELCISGDGLARGYHDREELTKEKFVANRFDKSGLMYRTGDLARWKPDGRIECLGRIDHQVKIRGFRIELGEIESCISKFEGITGVVVVSKKMGGNDSLVAYYTSNYEIDISALRAFMNEALPSYMIPGWFMELEKIPLTANGKVNRLELPEPNSETTGGERDYVRPKDGLESFIAGLWADVLNLDRVGSNEDFFELGGDSIKSIQISTRANESGVNFSPALVFEFRNVKEFAGELERNGLVDPSRSGGALPSVLPWLGKEQVRSFALDFNSEFGLDILKSEIVRLRHLHAATRLKMFVNATGKLSQEICSLSDEDLLKVHDLSGLKGEERFREAERLFKESKEAVSFDNGNLFSAVLVDFGESEVTRLILHGSSFAMDLRSWSHFVRSLPSIADENENDVERGYDETVKELNRLFVGNGALANGLSKTFTTQGTEQNGIDSNILFCEQRIDIENFSKLLSEDLQMLGLRMDELVFAALNLSLGSDGMQLSLENDGHLKDIEGVDYSKVLGAFARRVSPVKVDAAGYGDSLDDYLKEVKEGIRSRLDTPFELIPNSDFETQVLVRYLEEVPRSSPSVNFVEVPWSTELDNCLENDDTAVFTVWREKGTIICRCCSDSKSDRASEIIEALSSFPENLDRLIESIRGSSDRQFTPSDFKESGLGQNDLDALISSL